MAGDLATNDKGDVIRFDANTQAWVPAELAVNEKSGQRLAFDGEGWRELPSPKPAAPAGGAGDRILSSLKQGAGDFAKYGPLGPVSRAADAVFPGLDSKAGLDNAATGVARGVSGLVGMPRQVIDAPVDIGNWINRQINPNTPQAPTPSAIAGQVVGPDAVNAALPRASDVQGVMDRIVPPRTATTAGGRLAQDVGQAIGGAPFLPMMPYNIAAGLGSFGLGELTDQNPFAKALGSVIGLLGPAAWSNTMPNTAKMLARRLGAYSEPQLNAAEALQTQAQARGVPLMAQEALDTTRAGPMAQLAGTAAVQPEGAALQQFAAARVAPIGTPPVPGMPTSAIPTAIENAANTIGPRVANPNEVSRALGDAADAAVRAPQNARAAAATPFYDAARTQNIAERPVAQLVQAIDTTMGGLQPGGEAAGNLRRLRAMLVPHDPPPGAPGVQTNVGMLDEALREFEHIIAARAFDGRPVVPDTVRVNVQPVLNNLRTELAQGSQSYRRGLEIYTGTPGNPSPYTAAVDQAMASPAARISQAQNNPALEGATVAFGNWLRGGNGPVPAPATVRAEIARLNAQDPEAARQALRAIIQRDADAAFKITKEGVPPPDSGVGFVKQVAGTTDTRVALVAAIQAATGNNTTARGFNNLLNIVQRTGVTPGIGSPTATRGAMMNEAQGGGAINAALQGANLQRGSFIGVLRDWNETARAGRTWGELADLLTQPDSVAQIRRLALMNPQSERARALAATILQGAGHAPAATGTTR